jgi:leucine dehydrogenase
MRKTENIYNTTIEILESAAKNDITTNQAALIIAKNRLEERKKANSK